MSEQHIRTTEQALGAIHDKPHRSLQQLTELTSDLENLIAGSEIAVLFLDSELRIVGFTPKAGELFRIGVQDCGNLICDADHRLDYQELSMDAEAVLGSMKLIEREVTDDRGDWYLTRVRPYWAAPQKVHGVVFTFIDITDRRQAEEALRASEQRFRALVNASSDVWYRMSPNAEELRQLHAAALVADTVTPTTSWIEQYIPEEDQKLVRAAIKEAIQLKRIYSLEHRVRRADGSIGWVSSRAVPLLDPTGEITEWFGALSDITERKRGEEASKWLSAIVETSPYGIISKSLHGIVTSWNPAAERIFGYSECEIVGQPIRLLIPADKRQEGLEILQRLRAGESIHELETVRLRKDGSMVQVALTISPLALSPSADQHGDFANEVRAVEFVQDIGRRKYAEDALRTSERELRALAGSLLTAQEDERRRIARDLHDDVTQALALISIELGTMAAESETTDGLTTRLRSLQGRVSEVLKVVRHVSHGLHPSMLEDFGLGTALEVFCEEFSRLEGLAIQFFCDADESGLTVPAAACLYRVAQESLRNVRKHAQATCVTVELRNDGDGLRLSIHDNGVGIAMPLSEGPERGLGLVSMTERMRLVRGELSVSSTPGQGTDVIARVPVSASKGDASAHTSGR